LYLRLLLVFEWLQAQRFLLLVVFECPREVERARRRLLDPETST
jgi:hypothetical protein